MFDIAHPAFWQGSGGAQVPPFTSITAAQVRQGVFAPRQPQHLARTLAYLDALQARGRYTLMVWPVHCEIGSWGHGVHAEVLAACADWQRLQQRAVYNIFKGTNPWTEHYSALEAEVPNAQAPETCLNHAPVGFAQRLVLLTDGMSPVHGFEAEHRAFLQRMQAAGARLSTTAQLRL